MFYKMIENKCKEWYNSENCTVRNLIEYIEKTGQMRDAQIEAIKVYLFLKIGCECKPLEFLFRYGCFNSIVFLAGVCVTFRRFNVTIPKFFKKSHTASSP